MSATANGARLRKSHVRFLLLLASRGEMDVGSLTEAIGCKPAQTSRVLNALEKKQLIERRVHPDDKRSFLIKATDEGKKGLQDDSSVLTGILSDAVLILTLAKPKPGAEAESAFRELLEIGRTVFPGLRLQFAK